MAYILFELYRTLSNLLGDIIIAIAGIYVNARGVKIATVYIYIEMHVNVGSRKSQSFFPLVLERKL